MKSFRQSAGFSYPFDSIYKIGDTKVNKIGDTKINLSIRCRCCNIKQCCINAMQYQLNLFQFILYSIFPAFYKDPCIDCISQQQSDPLLSPPKPFTGRGSLNWQRTLSDVFLRHQNIMNNIVCFEIHKGGDVKLTSYWSSGFSWSWEPALILGLPHQTIFLKVFIKSSLSVDFDRLLRGYIFCLIPWKISAFSSNPCYPSGLFTSWIYFC